MTNEEARRYVQEIFTISTRVALIAKEYCDAGAPLVAGNLQAATTILDKFVRLANAP